MEIPTSVKITFVPCLILVVVALLLTCGMCSSQTPIPSPIDFDKLDYSQFSPEEIAATERHRETLKNEVKATLQDQAVINTAHGATLNDAVQAAADTKKAFDEYQKVTEEQISKGNKAIAALDHVLKKLHLAKWILCGVWIAACGLLYLKLPLPLKSYGLYGVGALAVGGVVFIWTVL